MTNTWQEYEYKGWQIRVYWTNVMGGWWGSAQDGRRKILEQDCESANHALSRVVKQIDKGGPYQIYH